MNSFIESIRPQIPDYKGSDEDLTLHYGDTYSPEKYDYPPDFLAEYNKLRTSRDVDNSSIGTEVSRGFSRGVTGLMATGAGALALGADAVGADTAKNYLLDVYRRKNQEMAAESPPSVPNVENAIQSPSAFGQYLGGKIGELVPNLGEAVAFGVAGSAVAPGPGTEAGVLGGLFVRGAARSALKKTIEEGLTPLIRKELEGYAAGKIKGKELGEAATKMLTEVANLHGATAANMANFAGLGAGGEYGQLSSTPGVTEQGAREGAIIAGIGSSFGAMIPGSILKKILPGATEAAAKDYVDLWAKKVPAEILTAQGGMGAMEFFNILAEKHADPAKKDEEFTKQDWTRILNAVAVGTIAAAPAVGITAFRGVGKKAAPGSRDAAMEEETSPPPPPPAPPPPPPAPPESAAEGPPPPPAAGEAAGKGVTSAQILTSYPTAISPEQELVMRQVAERDVAGLINSADSTYLSQLTPQVKARYDEIKTEVAGARKSIEEPPAETTTAAAPPATDTVDAETAKGSPLSQAVASLPTETKAALDAAVGQPAELLVPSGTKPKPADVTAVAATPDELVKFLKRAQGDKQASPAPQAALAAKDATVTKEAPARKVTAADLPDAADANKTTWYHGSKTAIDRPSSSFTKIESLLGSGFYLTDDPAVAGTYAKGGDGQVHAVQTDVRRVLNMEEPLPEDAAKVLTESVYPQFRDLVRKGVEEGKTGMEIWKSLAEAVEEESHGDMIPVSEYVEMFQNIEANLRGSGIDALTHIGGTRAGKGKQLHRVLLLLDPSGELGQKGIPATVKSISAEAVDRSRTKATTPEAAAAAAKDAVTTKPKRVRKKKEAAVVEEKPAAVDPAPVTRDIEAELKADLADELGDTGTPVAETPAPPTTPALPTEPAAQPGWLQRVGESISAWKAAVVGKEKETLFADLDKDPKNNASTKALGVFESPDGNIIVATIYNNKGEKVAQSDGRGRSYDKAVAGGLKPIGVIKTTDRRMGVYREYTKEEWAPHLAELERKVDAAGRGIPEQTPAVAKASGLVEQRPLKEEPAGKLTAEDAERIHKALDEMHGVPTADSAEANVSDAIVDDKALFKRIQEVGRGQTLELLEGIIRAVERAASKTQDPNKFREEVTRELTDLGVSKKAQGELPLKSIPRERSEQPAGDPEMGAVATFVTERLQRAGILVAQLQSGLEPLYGSLARSLGSFDRARKVIVWALSDLTKPSSEDIRVLFEEVGHALFDREAPGTRDSVLRALGRMAERDPDELARVKDDIAHAYPEGVPRGTLAEEIGMGFLSRKLAEEGFNPIQARGFAQATFRLLKELYLKAAMWVQQNLLGQQFDNKDLAGRYFQNRLEGFLAGDQETLSWIDRLGGPKPTHDVEVKWNRPVSGSDATIQVYNPVTGAIETSPLILESVEAALADIRSDDLRFAVPKTGERWVDPSVRLNQKIAPVNELVDARRAAADAAGVDAVKFRKLNGLSNTGKIVGAIAREAGRNGADNFDPERRLVGFSDASLGGTAPVMAVKLVRKEHSKLSRSLAADRTQLPIVQAHRESTLQTANELLGHFKDAEFMSGLMKKGLRNLVLEDVQSAVRVSKALGLIGQQLRDLEGRAGEPIDAATVGVLRRLYTGNLMHGEVLFDYLDRMANDPSIDFSQSASAIRERIRIGAESDPTLHSYNILAQDTQDSRAVLATVIAYGKMHAREMALLQVRRMSSGEERSQLEQKLRDTWKETRAQLDQGIRRVAKSAKLEEVARYEYRRTLRSVTRANTSIESLGRRISVNERALPLYAKAMERLGARISQTEDSTFGDGMVVRLPRTTEAGTEWEEKTIQLNAKAGQTTTVAEQVAMIDRLVTWTKAREDAARAGDDTALGPTYGRARRQLLELVHNKFYGEALRSTDHFTTELFLSNHAKRWEAMGTPTAGLIAQKMRSFVADAAEFRIKADRDFGYKNSRLKQNLLGILNDGRKWWDWRRDVSGDWFNSEILNSAMGFLERQQRSVDGTLEKDLNAAYAKLGRWLGSQQDLAPVLRDRMTVFMPALREYLESVYESGQWWQRKNPEHGLLVEDPKLGPGQLRQAIPTGIRTFQRKFSKTFFNMVHALRDSAWATAGDEFKTVADRLDAGDRAGVEATVAKFMDHEVHGATAQTDFWHRLTHVSDESVFRTPPIDSAGSTESMDPLLVSHAFEVAGGDVIKTFELMHKYAEGDGNVNKFIQQSLLTLVQQYKAANAALKKVEPRSAEDHVSFVGMIPNAMIDARGYSHWPGEWFDYHGFDRNENARMAERIAGQVHFGRDTRVLANLFQTAKDEVTGFQAKLDIVLAQASRQVPSGRTKDIRAAAEKILAKDTSPMLAKLGDGKARFEYLQKIEKRSTVVSTFLKGMSDYFDRQNSDLGSLKWGTRISQEISSLLVNNPASAISQLATMFDIPLQWGASPTMLKATGRVLALTSKDIAGSLAQGIGWQFLKLSYYEQKFQDRFQSPEAARRFGDIAATLEGEQQNFGARILRQAKEVQGFTVNRLGEKAGYTPLAPLAPFHQFVNSVNRALTVGIWEMSDKFVSNGVRFLRTNPGIDRITAESLGLRGLERDSFERWQKSIEAYGMRYEEMVRGAHERVTSGDRTILTNKDMGLLYSVALNEISQESNLATMPLWAFNNSLVRFITPLLGWGFRRTGQILDRRLSTKDEHSLRAVQTAMLGIGATALGGLGLSLVVDQYQEKVVGKKRNLRDLRVPTELKDWLAIEERVARSGTFGFFGDAMNAVVNTGTGQGDNRSISADQRIVALQSIQSINSAVNSFINQGFDADYAHVVRPAIAAIGGNGMLQYMQIVNHTFDLDNAESRVVKRINAGNYLSISGRDLGMSLKKSSSGYATPTPVTPWISRMEFAAYGNSPDEFRDAYRGAIAEAKAQGKDDPAGYVRQAYEAKHPLRSRFALVPSQTDYRHLLGNMDEQGVHAVRDAVKMFNYYGAHIGLTPFEGSAKKEKAASPAGQAEARLRALTRR